MKKVRIAVLVSGGGSNLQAIIDQANEGNIPHGEISLVISSTKEAYALVRANMAGIPVRVVSRKDDPDGFEENIISALEEFNIDMIVLAGFMSILSEKVIRKYPDRIINVHPSLIPSFCGKGFYGLRVHEAALSYGVKVTGATVHFVNEIPDGGKIILQKSVAIRKDDTPESLQKHVMRNAEWIILPRAVEMVAKSIVTGKRDF